MTRPIVVLAVVLFSTYFGQTAIAVADPPQIRGSQPKAESSSWWPSWKLPSWSSSSKTQPKTGRPSAKSGSKESVRTASYGTNRARSTAQEAAPRSPVKRGWWSRTKSFMNPWDGYPWNPPKLDGIFAPALPEDDEILTVNDWLSQEMPQ
jgi:hypothetical protein